MESITFIILGFYLLIFIFLFSIAFLANNHHRKKRKRDRDEEQRLVENYIDKNDYKYKKYYYLKKKKNIMGAFSVIFFILFIFSLLFSLLFIRNKYNALTEVDYEFLKLIVCFSFVLFILFFIFAILFNIYDYYLIKQRKLFQEKTISR